MNEKKVDVLAVMDAEILDLSQTGDAEEVREYGFRQREALLREARAAVAELIEAAIGVHAACRAGKEPDLIALADALDGVGVKAARKAALARISGAA